MKTPTKKSLSETGHAKNVANFQSLISFCSGFGAVYNPSKESLKIPQLQSLLENAQDTMNTTITQRTAFNKATNSRRNAFADLKTLSTKITNAFAVSGTEQLEIVNMKSMNKKLQGTTSKKASASAEDSQPDTAKTISTSQQSYDKMVEHFSSIIEILIQNPSYSPNEKDLKVTALQDKLSDMQTKNRELIETYTQYSNAMLQRNQILYDPLSGLVQTSKEIKQYVKSIFGASSPQYRQINGIEFKVIKGG